MAANRREIEDSWKSLQEKRDLSERQRVSVTEMVSCGPETRNDRVCSPFPGSKAPLSGVKPGFCN